MSTQQQDVNKSQTESIRSYVNYMKSLLPPEEIEKYEKIGQRLYMNHDEAMGEFKTSSSAITLEESLAYVVEGLKSGLHPKFLSSDEIHLLRAGYGDEWFTQWGYTREDVPIDVSPSQTH
jgi:hypothetical protein